MSKLLFGTDPEMVATYEKDGVLYALPPYYFRKFLDVPASSNPKHPVFLTGEDWKAHEDGAAFEIAVNPDHNPLELFGRVQRAVKAIETEILEKFPEHCMPKIGFLPTVAFEVERWKQEIAAGRIPKKEFEMSTRFGCDPDEDVFNLEARSSVISVTEHPWRYCGGHVHVSGSPKIAQDPHMAVKSLAVTAGLAAVLFSDVPQLEHDRTFYYGRPGKFRVQNYGKSNPFGPDYAIGVEYRTPSTRWTGNWEIAKNFLKWVEIGITQVFETGLCEELLPEIVDVSVEAITTANQQTAGEILSYVESRL